MKKLKCNKKFQPLARDEGDEFYPNGIFEFNITKLLVFIGANPEKFQPEQIEVEAMRRFPSDQLNESTIQSANLANPIVLAEIRPGGLNVIDGNHRLERAYRDGSKTILAYRVRPEHHTAFLTTELGYKKYIEYWNLKIEEMES